MTPPAGADPPAARGRHSRLRPLLLVVVALLALFAARTWAAEPLRIPSGSMEPTLRAGEHVLAEKVTGHLRQWRRGDVVVFRQPHNGELMIKRVVGVGRDTVSIEDGVLHVNGAAQTEPYADPARIDSVYYGPVRVPAGDVLVLGDNRENSQDSRSFGPVPVTALRGRIVAILWPPARVGAIGP